MQKYRDVLQDRGGKAIANALVRVQTYPGGVDATIYSDDGVTEADNPLTTGTNGEFSFYAADGNYQLVVTATGFSTRTITDIQLEDPDAASAGVFTTISATGQVTAAGGSAAAPAYSFSSDADTGAYLRSSGYEVAVGGTGYWRVDGLGMRLPGQSNISWTSGAISASEDLRVYRDGAGILAQRNGANAQAFRVYNTYTDSSNHERLLVGWAANTAFIQTEQAGTGSNRSLNIGTTGTGSLSFVANSVAEWAVVSGGALRPTTARDNQNDLGATTARVRDGYFGRNVTIDGSITVGNNATLGNASSDTLTINAGTWTIGSNFTANRSMGAIGAGVQSGVSWITTFSGDAGGTTDLRPTELRVQAQGSNSVSSAQTASVQIYNELTTGSLSLQTGISGVVRVVGAGHTGTATMYRAALVMTSTGSITLANNGFAAAVPTISGTGSVATNRGFLVENQGNAKVANAVGLEITDFSGATSTMRGIRSSLSAGTAKHNLYIDGTAVNYLAGQLQLGDGSASALALTFASNTDTGIYHVSSALGFVFDGSQRVAMSSSNVGIGSGMLFGWSSSATVGASLDVVLARDTSNTLAQRNGTSAQTFRLYNTYTDGSNYERLELACTGTAFSIRATVAGTGVARPLNLLNQANEGLIFGTNNTGRWQVTNAGNFIAQTDNTYDIGASGATRPRTGYFGTGIDVAGDTVRLGSSSADGSTKVVVRGITYGLRLGTNTGAAVIEGVDTTGSGSYQPLQVGGASIEFKTSNVLQARIAHTASAVNYLQVSGAIAADYPKLTATGSDTNIGFQYRAKGGGYHSFQTDGNVEQFRVTHAAGAVNYVEVHGNATGSAVGVRARGSDTDVSLNYTTTGAGHHSFYTNVSSGVLQFRVAHTASAVNWAQATGGATGNAVILSAQGSDTNIDLRLSEKGSGKVRFGTHTALGAESVTGYITIKDSGGTERKLAVVS